MAVFHRTIEAITTEAVSHTSVVLSCKLENSQFNKLFANSSLPDRAHLLSVSSPMLKPGFLLSLLQCLTYNVDTLEF